MEDSKSSVQRFRFVVDWFNSKPKMGVNAFFVDGLLIDTGHSKVQKSALRTLGKLEVEQIVLTHHHEDHTGNLQALKQLKDCPVYAHQTCARLMESPPPVCFLERKTWGVNTAVQGIIPIDKTIETEQYKFHIINTPGHSEDHICLYEANQGWLFSGDLYVHHYIRYFMATESVTQQIESLKKVLELDVQRYFCSHSFSEDLFQERFGRKLKFLEDFYGNVVQLHQKGLGPTKIMKELRMKEKWMIRLLSGGWLSGLNMVHSAIRDTEFEI
ncbi:MAG: MBL fold metallo-hydrolase [Aureispira sp.]|nr:MBL fold metallo-hydrolase [Aureispira sp.]